jgi:membrane fusion protein (multidrug efflux system)
MSTDPETSPVATPLPRRHSWTGVILVGGLLLLICLAVLLFTLPKVPESFQAPPPPAGIPVTVTRVRCEDVREWVTYPGRIAAWSETIVAAEQGGRITLLPVERGDRVSLGALLLQLDPRFAEIQVRQQQSSLRQLELDLGRLSGLQRSGSISTAEVDQATTRRDLARIALDQALLALEKCTLTNLSPGVVVDRRVEPGEVINPGQNLFKIADLDRIKVLIDLPERDVFAVRLGENIPFTLDVLPGREFTGTVHFVAAAADALSNTFRMELAFDNRLTGLKPGMIVRIPIDRGLIRQARVIPLQALIPEKGGYIAFQAVNGHAVRRVIKLLALVDTRALIAEGLETGDVVIVAGQRQVADGVVIVPTELNPGENR